MNHIGIVGEENKVYESSFNSTSGVAKHKSITGRFGVKVGKHGYVKEIIFIRFYQD